MRLAAPVNCWIMTKSSTYSLLSNASTDSLLPATGAQDDSPVRDLSECLFFTNNSLGIDRRWYPDIDA